MKNHQSIRIFKNPILELMTHVHPIVPLLLWAPIIFFFYYRSYSQYHLAPREYFLIFFMGLLIWTLAEYLLHRFLFHFETENKFAKYLVFLFHGLHHDDPHDPTRLVMPPVPALLITSFLYFLMWCIFPLLILDALFASFMIGYLFYDYIHYGTHHFAMKGKVAKYLKNYHLKHHFSHDPLHYGVSSPLWDYIFGTVTNKKRSSLHTRLN